MPRSPACAAFLSLLGACATPQDRIAATEDRLAAAGFAAYPADTPQREAMLRRLPADRFARRDAGGGFVYLYGDPLVCGCVYVGSGQAYAQYGALTLRQHIVDRQQAMVQLNPDPSGNW